MPADVFANEDATGTLASAATAGATTLTLTAGHGARFPDIGANQQMRVRVYDPAAAITPGSPVPGEIVKVTAHAASADTLTVVRGSEDTAIALSAGWAVDAVVTAAAMRNVLDWGWRPEDHGLHSWSYDHTQASATTGNQVSLIPFLAKVWVPTDRTFTNIWTIIEGTAAATLVSGSNRVGVYSSAGVLLSQSAATIAAWAANTVYAHPLAAPQAVQGGDGVFVWLARLMAATTMPQIPRTVQHGSGVIANLNLSSMAGRFITLAAVASGGSLPASFASATLSSLPAWIGAS